MGALDYVKTAFDLAKKAQSVELQGEILNIKEEVLKLQEENLQQKQRIAELERERETRQVVEYKAPSYYSKKPDGTEDGPFCQRCYDVDRRLVRMHDSDTAGGLLRECRECKSKVWVTRRTPPSSYGGGGSWMSR